MDLSYIEQYRLLYKNKPEYGKTSLSLFPIVASLIRQMGCSEILDYGCGQSQLADVLEKKLNVFVYKYDPAIAKFSILPTRKFDFVICTDVLQHIPIKDLNEVLLQIKKYSSNCFFYIKCSKHHTLLPNGMLANCTVHSPKWWQTRLGLFFNIVTKMPTEDKTIASFVTKGVHNDL